MSVRHRVDSIVEINKRQDINKKVGQLEADNVAMAEMMAQMQYENDIKNLGGNL